MPQIGAFFLSFPLEGSLSPPFLVISQIWSLQIRMPHGYDFSTKAKLPPSFFFLSEVERLEGFSLDYTPTAPKFDVPLYLIGTRPHPSPPFFFPGSAVAYSLSSSS